MRSLGTASSVLRGDRGGVLPGRVERRLALLLGVGVPRAYLAIALPVGIVGLMFNRRYWRRVGDRRRRNGKDLTSTTSASASKRR